MTNALKMAVAAIRSADLVGADQQALREEILDFCANHDDSLVRTCLEGHLTASAAVVNHERSACLLLHHVKLDRWLQPGGHADGDGDLGAVAIREVEEETGIASLELVAQAIDLDIHSIPARPGEPEHLHLDVRFIVFAPEDAVVSGNHESHELRWWSCGQQEPEIDPSTRRLCERALEVVNR